MKGASARWSGFVVAVFSLALIPAYAGAQETAAASGLRNASQLIGMTVQDEQGRTTGRITDLVLNDAGTAIAWAEVEVDGDRRTRSFNQRDDMAAAALSVPAAGARYSRLVGSDLRDRAYNRIGQVRDLVIDEDGRIALAVVATKGTFGFGERHSAVPWSVVYVHDQPLRLVVDAKRGDVKQVAFAPGADPYLAHNSYVQQVFRHFEQDAAPTYAFVGELEPERRGERTVWHSPLASRDEALAPPPAQIVEGTIQAIREFRTGRHDIHGGTELLLRTDEGQVTTVLVLSNAPLRKDQDARLAIGERVTIVGSRSTAEQRNYVIASSIVTDEGVIRLGPAVAGGVDPQPGPVRRVGPVDAFPSRNMGIVPGSINTPGGPVPNVDLLPDR